MLKVTDYGMARFIDTENDDENLEESQKYKSAFSYFYYSYN